MDIRKVALELAGKFPPNYEKYSRLEFINYLEEIFGLPLEKIEFYWRQAKEYEEDFYFLVLDLLQRKSKKDDNEKIKFEKLLKDLAIETEENVELKLKDSYKDEAEFTKEFLIPFFKKLGYKDVRYTHGTDEKGKDIVMKKENELGDIKYIGVQAKYGNIDAKASNSSGVTEIITQAKKAFDNDYDDIDVNGKTRISEYFIVTNGTISEKAKDEILNIEPTYFKNNIRFLDNTRLKNLLDKYQN